MAQRKRERGRGGSKEKSERGGPSGEELRERACRKRAARFRWPYLSDRLRHDATRRATPRLRRPWTPLPCDYRSETTPPRMVLAHAIYKSNETNKISKRTPQVPVSSPSARLVSSRFAPRLTAPTTRCRKPRCHQGTDMFDHVAERCDGRWRSRERVDFCTYISRRVGS